MENKYKDFDYDDLTTIDFHTDIMNITVKYVTKTKDIVKCFEEIVAILKSYDSSCFKSS